MPEKGYAQIHCQIFGHLILGEQTFPDGNGADSLFDHPLHRKKTRQGLSADGILVDEEFTKTVQLHLAS
jgi:hypothetical protein